MNNGGDYLGHKVTQLSAHYVLVYELATLGLHVHVQSAQRGYYKRLLT
jgi:hypothetical protein